MALQAGYGKGLLWVGVLLAILVLSGGAYAKEPLLSLGLGFEYANGKYGTDFTTDSIFVPVTVAVYPTKRLDFSVEIPYVYQSSSAVVAGMFRGAQMHTMTSTMAATTLVGIGPFGPGMTTASAANVKQSQSGLGDITAKGGYILVAEEGYIPKVRPFAFVKFPTADKDKFLGTGEFDGGFGVEVAKWFADWYTFGELGYTFQGKSSVIDVKNYLGYTIGAGYQVTENFRPMFMFKGATPPAEGSSALLEARLKLKYQVTVNTGIDGYLSKGITTSSPDYGVGVAAYMDF
jgi:hypothetical protein